MLVSTRGEGSARSKSWVQKPGFSSCKTQAPIIYGQRWHRDMLVQLTLDAAVRQITAGPGSASTEILDLLVETGAGVARLLAMVVSVNEVEIRGGVGAAIGQAA